VTPRRAISLVGAHTYATSISERSSASTPAAIRAALGRYSTWSFEDGVDLAEWVTVHDHGDVIDPDTDQGAAALAARLDDSGPDLWILLGGDNALTWRAMGSLAKGRPDEWGLITLDAHLDLREGRSNGSPVRQLLDEGLDGHHVVQIGLADFANSPHYARVARDAGVRTISRGEVRRRGIAEVCEEALDLAGARRRPIYLDVDMDVCDRSVAPGCPAAVPGGLSADELRAAVRALSTDPRVRAMDITEIDVERDAPDERTVRLAALVVLEAMGGVARRRT